MKHDLYSELFAQVARLDDKLPTGTLGQTTPMAEEPLLFEVDASLAFPDRTATRRADESGQAQMSTAIFGLFGPIGSLPYVYSEELARADRSRNEAMRGFFNLFNHRALSLMYRAWRKSRIWLEHHPGLPEDQQYKASNLFQGFCGLAALPPRIAWLEMERSKILKGADTMQRRVRNANGLQQLLRRQFSMEFLIEQFVGSWEPLPEEARSRFGATGNPMRLGYNTIIGSRTWQVQSTFAVVIPHPSVEQYKQLQPGSETLRQIQLMVRMYCTPELSFRLRIVVNGSVISAGCMGAGEGKGLLLGWNGVLGAPDPDREYNVSICKDYNESRMSA